MRLERFPNGTESLLGGLGMHGTEMGTSLHLSVKRGFSNLVPYLEPQLACEIGALVVEMVRFGADVRQDRQIAVRVF